MTKVPGPGETLSHDRLLAPIGSGGMSVVCAATPRFRKLLDGMK